MTTYTTSSRFWEGTPGDPAIKNAWGPPTNTNFVLIDSALNGISSIALSGSTFTLSVANGAPDQAREAVLNFTSGTAPCTVTLPNVSRVGWAVNNTGFTVTLTTGGATNATIPADGLYHLYVADGSGNVTLPALTQTATALSGSSLAVSGNASITGTLAVGATTITGNASVTGTLAAGNSTLANLTVNGNSSAVVASATSFSANTANVASLVSTSVTTQNLSVSGSSTFSNLTATNFAASGLTISGAGLASFGTGTGVVSNIVINPGGPGAASVGVNATSPVTSDFTAFAANLGRATSFYGLWSFFGTPIGSITPTGGGTGVAYNTTSDQTLKDFVGDLEAGTLIDKLRPLWFRWKDRPDADPECGFFAQQVYRIWPWAVTKGRSRKGRKDYQPWSMDAAKLMPLVVAELQALRARVRALEGR